MRSNTDKQTSEMESATERRHPSKASEKHDGEGEASEIEVTVDFQELADENEALSQALEKANNEISRLRDNLCDVSDIMDPNDNFDGKMNTLGKTFDLGGGNPYVTQDENGHSNLPDALSKTFDMGMKPVVIPVLDLRRLKQVKTYKDWYGYSQKLEKSVKLLRSRIKKLEEERSDFNVKFNKLRTQNQKLYGMNQKFIDTVKIAELRKSRRQNNYFWKTGMVDMQNKTIGGDQKSLMNMTQEIPSNLDN